MDELVAAFPDYRFLGPGREGGRRGEFSALLVRDERFEVLESGDAWLSSTSDQVGSRDWDAALPRMCTWAVLRDRASGAALFAMNTHFDHRGKEARRESAGVLLTLRARHAELPLIGERPGRLAQRPAVGERRGGGEGTTGWGQSG